ncbi:MAG: Uma2 family endonuclease, partial [Chloroflexota bacterium]
MTDVLQPPPAADADSTWPEGVPRRMTLEEYLNWDCEGVHAEWVDGEVVLMSPVRAIHQRILLFLARMLSSFCEQHELGEVILANMRMYLSSRPSGREPDLMFVSAAHADRIKDARVEGPADLVVEIISPESDQRDRSEKFQEYEAAGVPEYWLIDPLRHEALFYVLGEDALYHLRLPSPEGVYTSIMLEGFRLRPD